MADVKWIKLVTDIFDDEKILMIEQLPDGDTILVIWLKLLTLAGKRNNSGVFLFTETMPFTDEMFATIFRRPLGTVRLALVKFLEYGMIEIINNAVVIPNWSKHQTLDQIESRNEYMKEYMKEYRNKQKQLALNQPKKSVNVNSKLNSKLNVNPLEEEVEEEVEREVEEEKKEIKNTSMSAHADLQPIKDYWNSKSLLAEITTITDKRKIALNSRIKEHGLDAIYKAIDNVGKSKFMRGGNDRNWYASFDWVFAPNNFVKVLEGNYVDKEKDVEDMNARVEKVKRELGL